MLPSVVKCVVAYCRPPNAPMLLLCCRSVRRCLLSTWRVQQRLFDAWLRVLQLQGQKLLTLAAACVWCGRAVLHGCAVCCVDAAECTSTGYINMPWPGIFSLHVLVHAHIVALLLPCCKCLSHTTQQALDFATLTSQSVAL